MGKGVRVSISGKAELKAAGSKAAGNIKRELQQAVDDEAHELEADAKDHVRVDSGDLRDAIEARVGDLIADVAPRSGNLAGDYEKAMVNELGKSNDPGQPYMVPASEASRKRWPKRAEAAIKRGANG